MARHWPRRRVGDLDVPWRLRLGAWRIPLWRPGCCGKYVEAAQHGGCLGRLPWHDLAPKVDPVTTSRGEVNVDDTLAASQIALVYLDPYNLRNLQVNSTPWWTYLGILWYIMVYYGIFWYLAMLSPLGRCQVLQPQTGGDTLCTGLQLGQVHLAAGTTGYLTGSLSNFELRCYPLVNIQKAIENGYL